jgi:hypothetical protein
MAIALFSVPICEELPGVSGLLDRQAETISDGEGRSVMKASGIARLWRRKWFSFTNGDIIPTIFLGD